MERILANALVSAFRRTIMRLERGTVYQRWLRQRLLFAALDELALQFIVEGGPGLSNTSVTALLQYAMAKTARPKPGNGDDNGK